MIRLLPFAIELVLLIFCLIDCILTDESEVQNLPKVAWILIIIIVPLVGCIAWLAAGRPRRQPRRNVPWPATQTSGFPEYERPHRPPVGPEDDPEFLRQMRKSNAEHEEMLRRWEEDLRRRERRLGKDGDDDGAAQPEST